MKKNIMFILWVTIFAVSLYFIYNFGNSLLLAVPQTLLKTTINVMIAVFFCGLALGGIVFEFLYSSTSDSLNAYKRELEKESIDKSESLNWSEV